MTTTLKTISWAPVLSLLTFALCTSAGAHAHSSAQKRAQAADRIESSGNNYLVTDQFDKALPLIKQAIQLEPKRADYWQDLGVCFSQMHREGEAISAFRTADRLKPNYWLTLNDLAIALNKAGKHAEAVAVAQRAVKAAGPSDQQTTDAMNKIIHP